MLSKGRPVQLNNNRRLALDQGSITFNAGAVGVIETPGEQWTRVRFTDSISALVPTKLLNEIEEG